MSRQIRASAMVRRSFFPGYGLQFALPVLSRRSCSCWQNVCIRYVEACVCDSCGVAAVQRSPWASSLFDGSFDGASSQAPSLRVRGRDSRLVNESRMAPSVRLGLDPARVPWGARVSWGTGRAECWETRDRGWIGFCLRVLAHAGSFGAFGGPFASCFLRRKV